MNTADLPLKAVIEWDVRNWSHALDFWCAHTRLKTVGCRVLELGARRGGLSLYMAAKGATVLCSDIRSPAPDVQTSHRQAGAGDRISYVSLDATAIPFASDSFDIIIFKSLLGALKSYSAQQCMMREIYRVLRPAGELWFAENLVASSLHQFVRKQLVPWGRQWRYVSFVEIEELCSPFGSADFERYGCIATFGRTEWQRSMLGSCDSVLNSFIPDNWKYIVFGLSRK